MRPTGNGSSDIRVIIFAYRTENTSDSHRYIWRYTARRAVRLRDGSHTSNGNRPSGVMGE